MGRLLTPNLLTRSCPNSETMTGDEGSFMLFAVSIGSDGTGPERYALYLHLFSRLGATSLWRKLSTSL